MPSVFVSVAYPDVTVCCVAILLHTCINSTKIFPVRNWTRLLDAELPLFYLSSVWRVRIFVINLRNQISWLIFAALWSEKQARVVVILAVKDSKTQIFYS